MHVKLPALSLLRCVGRVPANRVRLVEAGAGRELAAVAGDAGYDGATRAAAAALWFEVRGPGGGQRLGGQRDRGRQGRGAAWGSGEGGCCRGGVRMDFHVQSVRQRGGDARQRVWGRGKDEAKHNVLECLLP